MTGLFLLASLLGANANELFTQDKLKANLTSLLEQAETYEKFKEITARQAKGGEVIVTITTDGVETQNTASEGDFIVQNTTEAGEQYIIAKDKFASRYEYKEDMGDGLSRYKAIGKIKAVLVSKDVMEALGVGEEFYFTAPWGEKMVAKKGDYLVSPLDYSEIYRIAEKEFFETYQKEIK